MVAVAAVGGCFDVLSLICRFFSLLSPSLWETAQYRLKYCLKGPFSPKQSTNHMGRIILVASSMYGFDPCFCFIDSMICFTDVMVFLSLKGHDICCDPRALVKREYLVIIRDNYC